MEKVKMFLVPEAWLKSLLQYATEFEEADKQWEYGKSFVNDKIHMKANWLSGYSKSSESILKSNEV